MASMQSKDAEVDLEERVSVAGQSAHSDPALLTHSVPVHVQSSCKAKLPSNTWLPGQPASRIVWVGDLGPFRRSDSKAPEMFGTASSNSWSTGPDSLGAYRLWVVVRIGLEGRRSIS